MLWICLSFLTAITVVLARRMMLPRPVHADLKCGDAPMWFGDDGLVVTWVGPMKESAKVRLGDGDIFGRAAEATGSDIPERYPEKYLRGLQETEVFNPSMAWSTDELTRWESRHGIEMEPGAVEIFQRYLDTKHLLFMSLVGHPEVATPEDYVACSLVLQRAVIVFDDGREDLYLRSYFHSAKSPDEFVNFVPRTGVHFSFPTDRLWFPLELTRLISEPVSFVELDVISREPFTGKAPAPFEARTVRGLSLGGRKFHATRLSGVINVGKEEDVTKRESISDFTLPVSELTAG